jgi:Ni,Fe-hydrogenase I cytochrome b subunit
MKVVMLFHTILIYDYILGIFFFSFLSTVSSSEDSLTLIRKSLRSVHMSQAEVFEETIPHIFVIFGASVKKKQKKN